MFITDREHAGRNGGGHRLTVARGDQPRGGARGRRRARVGDADQNRVDQLPLALVGQPAAMQQEDHVGKRRVPHEVGHIVAVNPDRRRLGPHDGGSPFIHEARIIALFGALRHVCNGSDTVTFLLRDGAGVTVPLSRQVS
jgi:hypothetical protein